jgi:hypothetical protein
MKREPDKYYKCIKIPLKSIIKHKYDHKIILENVNKITKININALQLIKLYYLDQVKLNNYLTIDENLILASLKAVCIPNNIEQKQEIQVHYNKMIKLYNEVYSNLNIFNNIDYDGLATYFQYLAIEIKTNFENNIKARYYDYVVRLINSFFSKKAFIKEINENKNLTKNEREIKRANFCKMLNKIKADIFNVTDKNYKSEKNLHSLINYIKSFALPNKNNYQKDSVIYDLNVSPIDYFKCMFKMTNFIELSGGTKYNLFPIKTSMIPRHMKLDTTTIVNLIFEADKSYYKNNISKENNNIWSKVLNLNLKVFRKKGYNYFYIKCKNNSIIFYYIKNFTNLMIVL